VISAGSGPNSDEEKEGYAVPEGPLIAMWNAGTAMVHGLLLADKISGRGGAKVI